MRDHVRRALDEQIAFDALHVRVRPPAAARRVAARALEMRRGLPPSRRGGLSPAEAGRQGIGSGVKRAMDIAAGRSVDAMQVHRFFARSHGHADRARARGLTFAESKAIQASDLWGGRPMWAAAKKALGK